MELTVFFAVISLSFFSIDYWFYAVDFRFNAVEKGPRKFYQLQINGKMTTFFSIF